MVWSRLFIILTVGVAFHSSVERTFAAQELRSDEVVRFGFGADEDLDFDQFPDDWTRRKGAEFPNYIETVIDRTRGANGTGESLRFNLNGGKAIVYSPLIRVNDRHAYEFTGYIRTQMLTRDAAMVSLSFLNAKRQRVRRIITKPVMGTHQGWVPIAFEPFSLEQEVRFLVIGCHLLSSERPGLQGAAWFDELRLRKLPRVRVTSKTGSHFLNTNEPLQLDAQVSGLDAFADLKLFDYLPEMESVWNRMGNPDLVPFSFEEPYRLSLTLRNRAQTNPVEKSFPLTSGSALQQMDWELPPLTYGHYTVQAKLYRLGRMVQEHTTAFVALSDRKEPTGAASATQTHQNGSFGWTFPEGVSSLPLDQLPLLAWEGGVNWLKYPLWRANHLTNPKRAGETAQMLAQFRSHQVTPVGLLITPPDELRAKFANEWQGVREVFTMPQDFWFPSMEPILARYSSSVRYWQLGDDHDPSFHGLESLNRFSTTVKNALDQIGRDTRVVIPWKSTSQPPKQLLPQQVLSLYQDNARTAPSWQQNLQLETGPKSPRWVMITPLSLADHTPEEQVTDLLTQIVSAKVGGADAIYLEKIFDAQRGIFHPDGTPTELFLAWRNAAFSLRGAKYLGSFQLKERSKNAVFAQGEDLIVVLWNSEPVKEEVMIGESVSVLNAWGEPLTSELDKATGQIRVTVGKSPVFIKRGSRPLAEFLLALQFEKRRLPSQYGTHKETLNGRNTFSQGISGELELELPDGWEVDPRRWPIQASAGESFSLPMYLILPANVNLGPQRLKVLCKITGDRNYQFPVYRDYEIGLGDLDLKATSKVLPDGQLEIEQLLTNNTQPEEEMSFRCTLFAPGAKRQRQLVVQLRSGTDRKFYKLPDAAALRGKELWLRAEQTNGPRIMNYRWVVE